MTQRPFVLEQPLIDRLRDVVPALVEQYQRDPASALTTFRASTRARQGFETEIAARDFQVTVDEPEELGGTNKGPNPVEVLLGTLGTCQEIVIVAYAAMLGIALEEVRIEVRGDVDLRGLFDVAEVPAGFENIHFDVHIRAPDATGAQLAQLKTLALGHCPVLDTLQRPVAVSNAYHFDHEATPQDDARIA